MSTDLKSAMVAALLAAGPAAPTASEAPAKKPRAARKPNAGKAAKAKAVKPKAPKLTVEQKDKLAHDAFIAAAEKRIAKYTADASDGSNEPIWHAAAHTYIKHFGEERGSARVLGLLFNELFQHRMTGLYDGLHWRQLDKNNSQYNEQGKLLWTDICEAQKVLLGMHMTKPNVTRRQFDMPWKRLRDEAFNVWPKPAGYGANPNDGKTGMERAKAPLQKVYLMLCNEDVQLPAKTKVIGMLAEVLIKLGMDITAVNEKITK